MTNVYMKHPFTMVISGPTGSGKTSWLQRLIGQAGVVTHPGPEKITFCYSEWQPAYDELMISAQPEIEFIEGLPENILDRFDGLEPQWLVIDDLMYGAGDSKTVSMLFTKGSHHRNLSVILLIQNFFQKSREMRTISLNAQYIVLFKNPRDKMAVSYIARQSYPNKVKQVNAIFEDATLEPFSYFFIDLKPDTPESLRLLQRILGESPHMSVYVI